MTARLCCLATLLLTTSACNFDGSTSNGELGFDEEKGDEVGTTVPTLPEDSNPESPSYDASKHHFVTSEVTYMGNLMSGSFRSLEALDNSSEMLMGEIMSLDESLEVYEKLEQRWTFTNVPSGQHGLTFVAEAYSPRDSERFTIAYRVAGDDEWTNVLLVRPGNMFKVHINGVDIHTTGDVEFRALLTPNAPALVEVVDEAGVSTFEPVVLPEPEPEIETETETETEPEPTPQILAGLEDVVPLRSLRVDYFGIRQQDQLSN